MDVSRKALTTSAKDHPIITHSSFSAYDCPEKFRLRAIERKRPVVRAEPLDFGGALHFGREFPDLEEGIVQAVKRLRKNATVLCQYDADRLQVRESMMKGMLTAAVLQFRDPPDIDREPEWLGPIINPATGRHSRKYRTAGKGDGLYLEANTTYCLIEEKTRGQSIGKSDIDKLPLDRQLLNAISGLQRSRGILISTVRYRYILKPFIKQRKDETVTQYCNRMVEDYEARPDFYCHEEQLLVEQESVRRWERDLWNLCQQITWCINNNVWFRNSSRCAEWAGCEYLPLCRGEFDAENLYYIEEPNPELTKEGSHVAFAD